MAGKRIAATAGTVYSRDQPQRRYVQEALVEAAAEVRQWVAEGAAIYVCGSLRGMAPGVDAALERTLGRGLVEAIAAEGRYRRARHYNRQRVVRGKSVTVRVDLGGRRVH